MLNLRRNRERKLHFVGAEILVFEHHFELAVLNPSS